ncbi:MAG: hypothetical protein ABIH83_02475 [Candidatus Micrarchaeota archaeon]
MSSIQKLEKPLRLPVGPIISSKRYMTLEDTRFLLLGMVMAEEKMDGKSAEFENKNYKIFTEDLKIKHSIKYKVPARYMIYDIFDKQRGMLLGIEGKIEIYKDIKNCLGFFKDNIIAYNGQKNISSASFFLANIMERGKFSLKELPELITYTPYGEEENTLMEGIVVKDIRDAFPQELRSGKIVRYEFTEGIEIHHMRKKIECNQINPKVKEIHFVESRIDIPREIRYSITTEN